MQIFIPLVSSDLESPEPPSREVHVVGVSQEDEGFFEASEDVRETASLASLELARDEGAAPVRLVASAFVDTPDSKPATWGDLDALYVDDEEGRKLSTKAVAASTQQEADDVVGRLLEEPLMWADVSERSRLHAYLMGESDW